MDFGIQFFPDVGPRDKPADVYFDESLRLCELADPFGYTHIRTVEHYFHPYGGYSPNPIVFLTAAAARTKKARLITGAVLPAFNNPLKIAGEAGMLDAISGGRLELGVARAFLPHEFEQFGVSLDESVARFDEGIEQIKRLLEEENVTMHGQFHSFRNVTSLPRPTQRPRPPLWTAALNTVDSFVKAGKAGNYMMAIPLTAERMAELLAAYRESWRAAGHPGNGKVMLAFHMFCHKDANEAIRLARDPLNRYLKSLVDAASGWMKGASTANYPNYDKMIARLAQETFESQVHSHAAFVGTPEKLVDDIAAYDQSVGGIDVASMQVNYNTISYEVAAPSVRLFGEKVIAHFAAKAGAAV
jgi:alkanesulfonate monooxygenase SsuD/methylene tetrahydromethanopterin reductase-like flavin-dependent oxidoreductase (luciferase family)